MKKYALYDTKNECYISFNAYSNEGYYDCLDVRIVLESNKWNKAIWMANNEGHADYILKNPSKRDYASYEAPTHSLKIQDIEIREIIFPD